MYVSRYNTEVYTYIYKDCYKNIVACKGKNITFAYK